MQITILSGHEMTSIKRTHEYLAKALRFPEYYGKNLDALADCLSELPAGLYVVLYGVEDIHRHLGSYAEKLTAVFEDISESPNAFNFILCD